MTPPGTCKNVCKSDLRLPIKFTTARRGHDRALQRIMALLPAGRTHRRAPTHLNDGRRYMEQPHKTKWKPAKRVTFGKEEQRNSVHFCTGAKMYALELAPTRRAPTANE